jgi:hypothetical protein
MKRLLIIAIILTFVPATAYSWDREGHMAVAAIAYMNLTPNRRQAIDSVLQSHPWYNSVWRQEYQQLGPSPGMVFPAYAFIRAAAWPDDIRDNPTYHHGTWHYVNFPLKPPSNLNTNTPIGDGQILTATPSLFGYPKKSGELRRNQNQTCDYA